MGSLNRYAQKFEDLGYDDLKEIYSLSDIEINEMISDVGFKSMHGKRFKKGFDQENLVGVKKNKELEKRFREQQEKKKQEEKKRKEEERKKKMEEKKRKEERKKKEEENKR